MITRTTTTDFATGKLQDVKIDIDEARDLLPQGMDYDDLRLEYTAHAAKTMSLIRRTEARETYLREKS